LGEKVGDGVMCSVWHTQVSFEKFGEDGVGCFHDTIRCSAKPQVESIGVGWENVAVEKFQEDV